MSLAGDALSLAQKDTIIFNFLNSNADKTKTSTLGKAKAATPAASKTGPTATTATKQQPKAMQLRIPDFEKQKLTGVDFSMFEESKKVENLN